MRIVIVFLLISMSFNAFAGKAQSQRFSKWFDILEKDFNKGSTSKVADSLLVGQSRVAAFNVQALGKIYKDQNDQMKKLRKDFKKLEDLIGEYKKWNDILAEAQKRELSSSKIAKLKRKKAKAKAELNELLEKRDWVGGKRLQEYQKFIEDYDFGTYNQDKKFVVEGLASSLEELAATDFDMTVLEEGNGVHELRRELRWFLIKARVLNGLIIFKKSNYCPVYQFRKLPRSPMSTSKYAVLIPTALEKNPCEISQCLFLGMVEKVNQLGELKDQIEADLNLRDELSDETPEKYLDELYDVYNNLINTQVIERVAAELNKCLAK